MATKMTNLKSTLLAVILAASVTSVAGCQPSGNADADENFFNEREASAEAKIMTAQASVGAAKDGSLYASHFDGNALNSLGKAKLDLMTSSLPDEGPLTVYLDLTKDAPENSARQDSVKDYLLNSHLAADQFKLVMGPNAANSHSTADAITNYSKTETSSGGATSGGSSSGSSATAAK